MATTIYESIKASLVSLFKGLYPDFDVFCEDISKTQNDDPEPDLENYVFLDIIPTGNTTAGLWHTDRRLLVDVALHTKGETNSQYLTMAQEVDDVLRPVFRFTDGGEARAITLPDLAFKVVDKVLHCTFTLAFRDSKDLTEQLPVMEELETTVKTNERT